MPAACVQLSVWVLGGFAAASSRNFGGRSTRAGARTGTEVGSGPVAGGQLAWRGRRGAKFTRRRTNGVCVPPWVAVFTARGPVSGGNCTAAVSEGRDNPVKFFGSSTLNTSMGRSLYFIVDTAGGRVFMSRGR